MACPCKKEEICQCTGTGDCNCGDKCTCEKCGNKHKSTCTCKESGKECGCGDKCTC